MDRISFTISIHGARDLPLDVDPDHLPFRLTHLLEIGEAHANPSCHGVFISSIPNGWFINNEATNIRSDLDSETQKINLRFDLHGSNLRMYTITQDVKAIHDREKIWCKLIDGNGEDTKGEVQISFQYKSAAPSTPNTDKKRFLIEVKIRNMTGFLSQMDNLTEGSFVWLSYELLGIAVQTDRFSPFDEKNTFPSRQNTFEFYGTNDETRAILKSKNAILKIYIRTDRFILGSFNVKLGALFCSENSTDSTFQQERQDIIADLENFVNQGKPLKDCIISDGDNDTKLHLSVRLQIQSLGSDFHYVSAESRKIEASTEKPPASIFEVHHHTQVEEKPSMYDQIIIAAKRTEVDEKQKQWAIFRRREEEKFRKHLRKKEEDVRRFLEQQIKRNEEDHTSVLEACRREYFSLESRLKKALAGIETKEREMKRKMDELEGLHEKKLVDLDLKEKILRKETQHLIDSEGTKLQLALKEVESFKGQAQEAEKSLKILRQRYQESDKGETEREVMRLKGRLIEVESELERREKAMQNKLASEKEHYRLAAHKLAKLVRQERTKQKDAPSRHMQEQFCDEKSESMNELQRIKLELSSLIDSDILDSVKNEVAFR